MIIKGKLVFLRDMIPEDMADYERWFKIETEWQQWDSPWEKWTETEVNAYLEWRADILQKPVSPVRSRFEICTVLGEHIGWVTCYPMNGDNTKPAVGIDIPSPQHRGQGRGKEAFSLFVDYIANAYRPYHLYCQTWSGNERMCRLAESVGFILYCAEKGTRVIKGVPFDALTLIKMNQ